MSGCAINLHSIINSGLIPGSNFEQQTDSVLSTCGSPWARTTRILIRSTWVYRVMHNTCIKHGRDIKTQRIGSTSILLLRKGLKFYQTLSKAIILHETLPAYCIPKVVRIETGEVIYEMDTCHLGLHQRSPWNTIGKRELGSEHAQRPEVVQQSRSFQSNEPIQIQVVIERGQPVVRTDRSGATRCWN